jgi:hypothetical protein
VNNSNDIFKVLGVISPFLEKFFYDKNKHDDLLKTLQNIQQASYKNNYILYIIPNILKFYVQSGSRLYNFLNELELLMSSEKCTRYHSKSVPLR